MNKRKKKILKIIEKYPPSLQGFGHSRGGEEERDLVRKKGAQKQEGK